MHIDQHRARLLERLAVLATLVESAFVAITTAGRSPLGEGPFAALVDEIGCLAHEIQADGMEFLVRFRPVATDLQFATATIACCSDLQVAAVAIDAFAAVLSRVGSSFVSDSVPSLDRMSMCVQGVISLAVDAISAWDVRSDAEMRLLHAEVVAVRERVRYEVAAAVVRPHAVVEPLMDADAAGCLLERIAAVTAACVRRVSRCGSGERGLSVVTS